MVEEPSQLQAVCAAAVVQTVANGFPHLFPLAALPLWLERPALVWMHQFLFLEQCPETHFYPGSKQNDRHIELQWPPQLWFSSLVQLK